MYVEIKEIKIIINIKIKSVLEILITLIKIINLGKNIRKGGILLIFSMFIHNNFLCFCLKNKIWLIEDKLVFLRIISKEYIEIE